LCLSALRGTERFTASKLLGVVVALVGVAVALGDETVGISAHGVGAGDLWMFGAAACGAVYNVFSPPYLAAYPALAVTAWSMLGGGGMLLVPAAVTGILASVAGLTPHLWLTVCFLGVVGTGTVFSLLVVALRATTPTRVAVFITLNPLVATVLSVGLLHEPVTAQFGIGLACVLAGIAFVTWTAGNP
jgi:drug/metabolite transporter (DMT)-like permease